jgi:hypothetical protein
MQGHQTQTEKRRQNRHAPKCSDVIVGLDDSDFFSITIFIGGEQRRWAGQLERNQDKVLGWAQVFTLRVRPSSCFSLKPWGTPGWLTKPARDPFLLQSGVRDSYQWILEALLACDRLAQVSTCVL